MRNARVVLVERSCAMAERRAVRVVTRAPMAPDRAARQPAAEAARPRLCAPEVTAVALVERTGRGE